MEEETWNPLEVRDLMTRVASGVDPEETTPWEQVAPRQIDGADYVIPGNDDAIRSCSLVARVIADAIEAGRGKVTAEELAATAAEAERPEAGDEAAAALEPQPAAVATGAPREAESERPAPDVEEEGS